MNARLVVVYVEIPEGEDVSLLNGMRTWVPGWRQDYRSEVVEVTPIPTDGEDT